MASLTQCKRVKETSSHRPRRHALEAEVFFYSLTSALDGGEWQTSRPGRFTPDKEPRAWLDGFREQKIPCSYQDTNTRTFQSAAGHFTNYAVPADANGI